MVERKGGRSGSPEDDFASQRLMQLCPALAEQLEKLALETLAKDKSEKRRRNARHMLRLLAAARGQPRPNFRGKKGGG